VVGVRSDGSGLGEEIEIVSSGMVGHEKIETGERTALTLAKKSLFCQPSWDLDREKCAW
jgi:hypothetical protein